MTNEEFQQLVLSELKGIHQRFDTLESKVDKLENQLNTQTVQQHENTDYTKVLLHQAEELTAKYDDLLNITVSKEAFEKVATKIDIINCRILLRTKKSGR